VVSCINEVLTLEVTHGRRVYRRPRSTETSLREELAGTESGIRIRGLRRRVTSLNRLDGLGISTYARSRLAVRARIRKRTLDAESALHLLETLTDGSLGTGIRAQKICNNDNAAKDKC
jgi:hypothetical protein